MSLLAGMKVLVVVRFGRLGGFQSFVRFSFLFSCCLVRSRSFVTCLVVNIILRYDGSLVVVSL